MRYRFTGDTAQSFPGLGLELEPGQEFETDEEIIHPHVVKVEPKKTKKEEGS